MEKRKQAEEAPKRTEQESILNSLVEHVIHEDTTMKILWANQAACVSAGLPLEELMGRRCYEIWPKRGTPCPDCPVVRAMETGKPQKGEKTTPDGRSWFIRGYPVRNVNGDVKGAIEVTLEITEHKKAEKALRESEEKFRIAFENAKDAIFWADPTTGFIINCNKAAETLLQKKRGEILGSHQTTLHPPQKAEYYAEMFKRHIEQEGAVDDEAEIITKSGKTKPVHITASTTSVEGKPIIQGIFRDITKRKQAEELYRSVIDLSPDSIITVDTKGVITSCNPAATRMLGYSKDEMVGKHFSKIGVLRARDLPKYLKLFISVLKGRITKPLELTFYRKDGIPLLAEVRVSLLKEGGKTMGLQAISRDITESKKAEEALRESEQRLRNIIDTSPDAIVWTDTTGKITLVNRKGFELTGFSEKELIGKNFMDVEALTQESKEKILDSFVKRIEGIDTPPYEVEVVAKNREIIPAELSASPIYEGDKIVGTQSIFRDLRERKKAEEALRESEAKFRNLAEQSPNMIFINKNGSVVYANKKCEEIMGYKREEFYSPDFRFLTLIAPESVDLVKSMFSRHMKGEEVAPYEYKLVTKEGKKIEAIVTPKLIRYDGESAILGVITDITERKKAEEAVRHYSEHLEELVEERTRELKESQERLIKSERLAAIGEVATMVGHDLRNPLQSIEIATYYLSNELPRLSHSIPDPQKTMEMLKVINDSVDYADKIVRDLRDFSGTKKPLLKETDINAIVKEAMSQVETPENVRLITKLGRLPEMKVDKEMIKRVFLNLAMNGIEAMEKGGTLKVSTKKTKDFVEVSFKDTGVGISKEDLRKIFTPFFTRKAKGLGVGLAICKRFVDSHGGSIEVESREGKGSTFTVKLPI